MYKGIGIGLSLAAALSIVFFWQKVGWEIALILFFLCMAVFCSLTARE